MLKHHNTVTNNEIAHDLGVVSLCRYRSGYILTYCFEHIYSTEATTQPYVASTSEPELYKPNYYQYYQKKTSPEQSSTTTTTTMRTTTTTTTVRTTTNPFRYYFFTTRRPITEKTTEAPPPSSTQTPVNINSISTTKNPYDFYNFTNKAAKSESDEPKRGFFKKEELDSFFGRGTTKSPFSNKVVKSLFKIGTFYSQAKSSDNSIRPDANSQQVQIEPARLVYSYQRNLTSGEIIRT